MQQKFRSFQVFAISLLLLLAGCGENYRWGWYVVDPQLPAGRSNLQFLVGGLLDTVLVSVTALVVSMVVGLLVALAAFARWRPLRVANRVYVEIFRAIPVLVMLLWVFYGLPVVVGLRLDVFTAGVLALALCDSAFEAEIFRAGIQSIEKGQHEAAESLGLGTVHKLRFVILPQAIRRILPPLCNQFVYIVKMSSLVSVIGLGDLTRRANELVVTAYRPLEIYTVLMLEYLVLVLLISYAVRRLEQRMGANLTTAR
jgi:polar amino acid transport system permease protein